MSRSNHSKEKHGKSNWPSVYNGDEESAARTRPFSFEEIMLRRRNKELVETVKNPAEEEWKISAGDSVEKADHFEHARIDKSDQHSSFGSEKHASEELVNLSSRKKVESICVKNEDITEGKDKSNDIFETKSSGGLNNEDRITKENTGTQMHGLRKNERTSDSSEYKAGNMHSRGSIYKDRYAETNRPKSELTLKKKKQIREDENPNEHHTERRHDKDRHDRWKMNRRLSNDSEDVPEKKHHRDSDKDKHAWGRVKNEREIKRKYRNRDDEIQDRNATRKQDPVKHHNPHNYERKERQEKLKSHYEESATKRRRSRSKEHGDRRRSPSFSPREQRHTHPDAECKELSLLSLKDSSKKKHSDVDRNRSSTNGSSSHHHRHGGSTSGLGGYSPRKRKSEAAARTPSPSKHSLEKKRAGWDLTPVGTDKPSPAVVSSSFQSSNYNVLSSMRDVALSTSLDIAIGKSLPVSFLNDASTEKNAKIDSVQLTQATRPMRRLYLENLPASVSEKTVMDCFNSLLLPAGVNRIQQVQPCISCILHRDRGQALVEFLTAEDASAALSFDESTLFGSTVKIRRPKDYVEVASGERERSMSAAVTISDVVIDSPYKIFVGGISSHLSSEMLMEIAGAFGSLKAYHFVTDANNGSHAFLEYADHSVTIKACAGLNGMKLGGEVLTVVQSMPDAPPLANDRKAPSYEIPDHAKPLLRKPTQVLEIKNVFAVESISTLSDMAIEEILEDVRLECARFGTVKSINAVKHNNDKNSATKTEQCEVISKVDSKEAPQDTPCVVNNAESSFSGEACPMSIGANGVVFQYGKELEEDKVSACNSVDVDRNAVLDNKSSLEEQPVGDTTVEELGSKTIPPRVISQCLDHQETSNDGLEFHDKLTDVDIEKKMVDGNTNSINTVCASNEGFPERDTSSELVPKKGIDEEDDIHGHVFEPGSVLVEYGRTEACQTAAHCLHGRLFDGRMVRVEYVALNLYRAKFTK